MSGTGPSLFLVNKPIVIPGGPVISLSFHLHFLISVYAVVGFSVILLLAIESSKRIYPVLLLQKQTYSSLHLTF